MAALDQSLTQSPSPVTPRDALRVVSRDADAPRPRRAKAAKRGQRTVSVPAGRWLRPTRTAPVSEAPLHPRARTTGTRAQRKADLDNALHGSGLAIGGLLEALEDDLIETDVGARLRRMIRDANVDPADVDVIVEGAHVTLVGEVDDSLTRLLIEDLAWSVPNVDHCVNQLAVR